MILSDSQIDSGALARRLLAPANNLVPVNLLTRQDASFEDATISPFLYYGRCTGARTTSQAAIGSASLALTSTNAVANNHYVRIPANTGDATKIAATAGKVYTARASVKSSTGGAGTVALYFVDSANNVLTSPGTNFGSSSAWTDVVVTGVAPAGTISAVVHVQLASSLTGDVLYVDKVGLWEGAGGSWVNGGERLDPSTLGGYWNAAGTGYYRWNTVTNAYVLIYGS